MRPILALREGNESLGGKKSKEIRRTEQISDGITEHVLCALTSSMARKYYCRNAETLEGFLFDASYRGMEELAIYILFSSTPLDGK